MTEHAGDGTEEEAIEAVVDAIRAGERFVLVAHENVDGDALGSLIAMQGILGALGKDAVVFMSPEEQPLPHEYRFLPLTGFVSAAPPDIESRTIIFLDCGNIDRNPAEALKRPTAQTLNIDHHHDNTRFGTINLVLPDASCTAEIVWELMRRLALAPSPQIADALYVGLVTDTGRFMYENTSPRAHLMAAALIDAGVDVRELYRRLYEDVPYGKLALLARGLANVERYDAGRLTIARLTRSDFEAAGAEENYSEGVIDHLRAVEGTVVAGLVRDRLGDAPPGSQKVSLRACDDRVDVSAIARAQGGGGHRPAAGFTTTLPWAELIEFLRARIDDQLQPAGP